MTMGGGSEGRNSDYHSSVAILLTKINILYNIISTNQLFYTSTVYKARKCYMTPHYNVRKTL